MADEPSSPKGNPPESHEAWANTTKTLVGSASSVTSELYEALKGTDALTGHKEVKLNHHGKPKNVDRGPHHAKILDAKLEVTKIALNSDEASAQRCCQILSQLGHERQSKFAAIKVVEWRLALRERRPKSELFRDHLQEALENEKKTLEDSRKVLVDRAAEVKMAVEDCEANKAALGRYVRFMICLGETNPPPIKTNEDSAPVSPAAAASADADLNGEAAAGEEGSALKKPDVPADLDGLIARAPFLHELSLKLYFRGEKLIISQKAVCQRANEKVLASFLKRAKENKELKDGLEAQISEMEEAVATAEKSMTRMKKDIEFFGKVELQPKVDSTSAIVEKLKVSKQELVDDLLRKVVGLRIDDCCRKITPERTCQPPESMPVAALLENNSGTKGKPPAGRKRPQNLTRVTSSPAFVNGNIDSAASTNCTTLPNIDSMASTATNLPRPSSPAGLSSPLKAAAAASMAS